MSALDKIDRNILAALHDNARMSYKRLAEQVGLSAPAVSERVIRLQERGVLHAFRAQVDAAACGLPISALVLMRVAHEKLPATLATVEAMPEALACRTVTGEYCLAMDVVARDIAHLDSLTTRLRQFGDTYTMIVKQTWFAGRCPPLHQAKGD